MKIKIEPLDKIFSEYIRKRAMVLVNGCERCLHPKVDILKDDNKIFPAWKQLECSHFYGRGKRSVRWDTDNASGLCFGCHQYFTSHPLEHMEWFKQRLGEDGFDLLTFRANKPHKPDKGIIKLYLERELGKLDGNKPDLIL